MKHRTRFFIAVFTLIIAGLIIGPYVDDTPGFVVVVIDKTTYEMRLWLAIAILATALVLLICLAAIVRIVLRKFFKVWQWQDNLGRKKARQQTINGMIAFAEGNWQSAEKLNIAAAAKHSDAKMLNYLIAAQSAQQQKESKRRDNYLALAQDSQPNAKVAVYLTQAQLQVQEGQLEQAVATLSQLQSDTASRHKHVLKLLAKLYDQLMDWQQLLNMIPQLRKLKVFNDEKLADLESRALRGVMTIAAKQRHLEQLKEIWHSSRQALQKNIELVDHYAKLLIILEDEQDAEMILRDALKRQWDDNLVLLYGKTKGTDKNKQLSIAETWLKQHPSNPYLLITLGRLCLNAELWGKAQSYLEDAINLHPIPEAYVYLGQAKEQLNQPDAAFECYKQGLQQAVNIIYSDALSDHIQGEKTLNIPDLPLLHHG